MTFSPFSDLSPFSFNVNFPLDIGNNLIHRQNSFPYTIPSPSSNEQEEENLINICSSLSNLLSSYNYIEEELFRITVNPSTSKISSPKKEKPKEKVINNFYNIYSNTISSSKKDKNNEISLLEDEEKEVNDLSTHNHNVLNKYKKKFVIKKKPLFKVKSPKKNKLFISAKNSSDSIMEGNKKIFLGKKREKREKRKDDLDNIRAKIKRNFINSDITDQLNKLLKKIRSINKLYIFPGHLVRDVNKKRNQIVFGMTLLEFFEKKELYILKTKSEKNKKYYEKKNKNIMKKYEHNLKIIHSEQVKENKEFQKILNKKMHELYEEYINSPKFKIEEINRLKKKNCNDNYINRYINLANDLIQFFNINNIKNNDFEKKNFEGNRKFNLNPGIMNNN